MAMFNLFKKKSKQEVLQAKYQKLVTEAYQLSHTNRSLSDQKQAEAEAVRKEMEAL